MSKLKLLLFLFVITSTIAFLFQGKRGLWEPDEGRYAECAREMVITNDYILPKLNFEPHLSKPPITYWAIALSLKIFGKNEFAVRLPNSIAFFLTVFIIFLIGEYFYEVNRGIVAGIIYSTSIFPFIGLNIVTTDTILTFFIWLYLYFYFKKDYYLMSISMGLAFLTKGPPSLLPFLGILVYSLIFDRKRIEVKKLFICLGIFFIIGFSWYVVIVCKEPFAFNYFIKNELIGRLKGIHHRNSGPFDWLIYFPILIFGLAPWILIYWKKILTIKINDFQKKLILIIVVPLIIFCFAKSRLPLYILPLMPGIALLIASQIDLGKSFFKIAVFSAIFLICLRIGAVYFPYSKNDGQIYKDLKKYILERDLKLNFITTRVWNGLNFYFETIPEYLSFSNRKLNRFSHKTVKEKLKEIRILKKREYILISDLKKIKYFEKILRLTKFKNLNFKKFVTKRFTVYRFN